MNLGSLQIVYQHEGYRSYSAKDFGEVARFATFVKKMSTHQHIAQTMRVVKV